jgi:EmrB/QacA subfamily drug resistance transporter
MKNSNKLMASLGILLGTAILGGAWSSVNVALAAIQDDLGANLLELGWMMNSYGIAMCATVLPIGKLGDRWGRKRIYMLGILGLLISCFGAGTANSINTIIAFMALLGVSGASILSLSQALMVHQYPENQKSKAIAIWGAFTAISLSLGPLLGGVIIKYLSWRWVFLINTLPSLLAFILVAIFVKEKEQNIAHHKWAGMALFSSIITGVIVSIMQGPSWGWLSWKVFSIMAWTIGSLVLFLINEKKSKSPLFHPNLFANRSFLLSSICNGLLVGFVWSIFFFVPLYLQNQKEMSPMQAGFNMLLITLPVTLFSIPISTLYEKLGAKPLLMSGFFLLFLSVFFHGQLSTAAFCLLIGLGWVLTWGPSTTKALSSLPYRMAGVASGMFMTLQEIGGVLGLTISSVVFRIGRNHFLAPKMKEIESVLQDQTTYLLSNPNEATKFLQPNSPILTWLLQGFKIGHDYMLLCLSVLMFIAIVLSFFIPKKTRLP